MKHTTLETTIIPQRKTPKVIQKFLKSVNIGNSGAQVNTTLHTMTFPGTLIGLRWNASVQSVSGTYIALWVIIVVPDGQAPNAMEIVNATLYRPEENVLAFGAMIATSGLADTFKGKVRTMRKLKQGDQLVYSMSRAGGGGNISGAFQFFIQT